MIRMARRGTITTLALVTGRLCIVCLKVLLEARWEVSHSLIGSVNTTDADFAAAETHFCSSMHPSMASVFSIHVTYVKFGNTRCRNI